MRTMQALKEIRRCIWDLPFVDSSSILVGWALPTVNSWIWLFLVGNAHPTIKKFCNVRDYLKSYTLHRAPYAERRFFTPYTLYRAPNAYIECRGPKAVRLFLLPWAESRVLQPTYGQSKSSLVFNMLNPQHPLALRKERIWLSKALPDYFFSRVWHG